MNSDPNYVSATEFGIVRLFSTELEPPVAAAITAQNVYRLLGEDISLDTTKVEVINSMVLDGLGLRNYLVQGYGIAEADLVGKAAALDALTGLIILIPTSAFQGLEQTLDPNPAMRFIGVFREEAAKAPAPMAQSEAATGFSPSPTTNTQMQLIAHKRSWIGALGALLVAAALVLFFVL
ncbi:MAG: hypothetical protein ACR2O1_04010 [Boseongicola sp.]